MSSVSSIGGGANLYSFLQSVTQSSQTSSTGATSVASSDPTAGANSSAGTDASQGVQGHHRHGHHGGGDKSNLFSQLQQTVSSALQTAQQDGTDPNQAIQDAIAKVFQNNNSAPAAGTSTTASSTTDPDAAQANTPASVTGDIGSATGNTSGLQAFFQTLQSFGVDPQQFHQDFLNAAQGAQNGTANASSAFQSFPPGSLIDTTA